MVKLYPSLISSISLSLSIAGLDATRYLWGMPMLTNDKRRHPCRWRFF
jgi:hypothetical protein